MRPRLALEKVLSESSKPKATASLEIGVTIEPNQ
jgi:hypothetical protein